MVLASLSPPKGGDICAGKHHARNKENTAPSVRAVHFSISPKIQYLDEVSTL